MVWEGRIVWAGEWVECKVSVAPAVGESFSWAGNLMMRPEEWLDFCVRMKLVEISKDLWASDVAPDSPAPQT